MIPRWKKSAQVGFRILLLGLAIHLEAPVAWPRSPGQGSGVVTDTSPTAIELVERAKTSLTHLEPLVGSRVARRMTIFAKDGTQLVTQDVIEHAYQGEKRIGWTQELIAESGKKGFTIELSTAVDTAPSTLLDGYRTWTLTGRTTIDGTDVTVLKGADHESTQAIAYVDAPTGALKRLDLDIDVPYPGVKSYRIVIDYTTEEGVSWPNRNRTEVRTSFLLGSRQMIIERKIEVWSKKSDIPIGPKSPSVKP